MVSGDGNGKVGFGTGRGKEVDVAMGKAKEAAHKNMKSYPVGESIPHTVWGRHDAGLVRMDRGQPDGGLKCGPGTREIMQCLGVKNVLTKCLGSTNAYAVIRATLDGLEKLRTESLIKESSYIEKLKEEMTYAAEMD